VRYINLRGIDNATYYTLADDKSCYWDSTGTGNNLNASRAAVRNLIVDSLTYWANTMHVDGFRFDLAYELGREGTDGRDFNNNATTLVAIAQAASNNGFKVIAEPVPRRLVRMERQLPRQPAAVREGGQQPGGQSRRLAHRHLVGVLDAAGERQPRHHP
jgi:glycosidase